jgi:Antibiotic biosynthesis monooxygenase
MPGRPPAATAITPFAVRPGADDAFVGAWERARDPRVTATLHRALRPDVGFRFVELARAASADAGRTAVVEPDLEGGDITSHPALYELVHDEGDVDGAGGVIVIEFFEVAPGADERFAAGWGALRRLLAERRGHLGARLHRSLGPARFGHVGVARWSSPLMVSRAAADPEIAEASGLGVASHAAVYQAIRN